MSFLSEQFLTLSFEGEILINTYIVCWLEWLFFSLCINTPIKHILLKVVIIKVVLLKA